MRVLLLVFAVAAVSLGAQVQQGPVPAGLERQSWTVNGVARTALVAVPRSTPGTRTPLVIVFHGHGGSSANAARTFQTHTLWPEALVIYPQGLPTVGQVTDPEGRLPGWQHRPGGEHDRDLKFVDGILEWVAKNHPTDPRRQFVAGHSNGGSMTYVLWAARGDRFAAFAPSSSVFSPDVIRSARPKPAFIIAGREDPLVPFIAQRRSLDDVLSLNGARTAAESWSGDAMRHRSRTGADVIAYIHPGGHPMPADAGSLIVKFFREIAGRN